MPQTCKYWQQGECKKGDSCLYDHPGNGPKLSNDNRFTALQTHNQSTQNLSNRTGQNTSSANRTFYSYKESIIHDLTVDRPQWPLSAYALGRNAPAQLFGGFPREQSFEEMRLHHYLASSDPKKLQQAIIEANNLAQDAEKQIQHAVQYIDEAVKYLIEAGQKYPNRVDICRESQSGRLLSLMESQNLSSSQIMPNKNVFNGIQQASEITPALGELPAPVFGTTSQPSGAFGQPSTIGQKINPFSIPKRNLGSSSQPRGVFDKSFGSTSSNNYVNPNTIPLGQRKNISASTEPPKTGIFGCQNTFSSPSFQPSGGISLSSMNPNQGKAFSHSNVINQSNSPFKPVSAPPFGVSPSPSSSNNTTTSLNPSNQFAITKVASVSQSSGATQGFGRPNFLPNSSFANGNLPTGFGGKNSPHIPNPMHSFQNQSPMPHSAFKLQNVTVTSSKLFKDKSVVYNNNIPGYIKKNGTWERIWFLDGKPSFHDENMLPETLYDEITTKAYSYAVNNKKFENGIIPSLPPKEEWCRFDF